MPFCRPDYRHGLRLGPLFVQFLGFVLVATFPYLNAGLDASGTFWLDGAICVIGYLLVLTRLPETKGKSREKIERELAD